MVNATENPHPDRPTDRSADWPAQAPDDRLYPLVAAAGSSSSSSRRKAAAAAGAMAQLGDGVQKRLALFMKRAGPVVDALLSGAPALRQHAPRQHMLRRRVPRKHTPR